MNYKIGFEDDQIFLLSMGEYERYKKIIPHKNCWWWLRSPGINCRYASYINSCGNAVAFNSGGFSVDYANNGVRPVIKCDKIKLYKRGELFIKYGTTWVVIDHFEQIAIAENPIHFMQFDRHTNDYLLSDVRDFLLKWVKERQVYNY